MPSQCRGGGVRCEGLRPSLRMLELRACRPPSPSPTCARPTGAPRRSRGVELEVGEGELFGLLGPNGAGKSTLVKIACGLVRPTAGTRARSRGAPAGSRAAQRALGYLAELFRFPDWLSADELLALHQRLAGLRRRRGRARASCSSSSGSPSAAERRGRARCPRACSSGSGSRRRWSARRGCCCSTSRPARSTPPAGAPSARLLEELRSRGVAVLLNSHLLSEVELVCDRVAIIARGEVVAAGTPAELSPAGGVEVETAAGTRALRRRDAARTRRGSCASSSRPARRSTACACSRSSLEDAYLEAVGGARVSAARTIARLGLQEALRRRVFVVVAAAHGRLPRPLRARHLAGVQVGRRIRRRDSRGVEPDDRRGRDAARAGDVRDAVPRHDPRRLPHARARSAATPSAGCCSRCSCARCRAARCSPRASPPPALVCAAYVIVGLRWSRR